MGLHRMPQIVQTLLGTARTGILEGLTFGTSQVVLTVLGTVRTGF